MRIYALKKSSKWKSPGKDKIPNFWLNAFHETHTRLTQLYNLIITDPKQIPQWLVNSITYLLPKSDETNNRPITCLTTMYKILTSILTEYTYSFLIHSGLFPDEQKGYKRGSYGCKDQLLINKMILENYHNRNTKAFDSVLHSWIEKYLATFKISPVLRNFLSHSMRVWKATLVLNTLENILNAGDININSGIFKRDSLSPILFCVTLIPLSKLLNNAGYGYKIYDNTINHHFYMDDLKLFAKNDQQLQGLLNTVKQFSDDIRMELGLDKCPKATFSRGKLLKTNNITLDTTTIIKDLEPEESYKYLGVTEWDRIQHSSMREKIRKKCFRRVRTILRSELNARNRIDAINSLALPMVTYSFTIINLSLTYIKKVDTKIRKLLTMHRMHHPKSDVNRSYLPRKEGGRGLVQLELPLKTSIIGMDTYLNNTNDWILKLVKNMRKINACTPLLAMRKNI